MKDPQAATFADRLLASRKAMTLTHPRIQLIEALDVPQ